MPLWHVLGESTTSQKNVFADKTAQETDLETEQKQIYIFDKHAETRNQFRQAGQSEKQIQKQIESKYKNKLETNIDTS